MSQAEPTAPALGDGSEPCASCGAALARDQRYCLNCGERSAERRVPTDAIAPVPPLDAPAAPPGRRSAPALARYGGTWGVAALVLVALGVGVVIGSRGKETQVAGKPPTVTIAAGAVGGAPATAAVSTGGAAADEWPDRDGFTVQLGELAAGTDQAAADAAKAAAEEKGAKAPGVLDAGAHGLTAGTFVVYDGVFDTRKQATKALGSLKEAYPDARVIKVAAVTAAADAGGESGGAAGGVGSSPDAPATVSKSDLKQNENLDPAAFQKKSKKLPKTTALPGKPPPKDNAAPGGGSAAESIG